MTSETVNGIFGIAGALIGVAGTWFVTHRFQQCKHLTITISPLARLLDIGDNVKSEVEVRYKDQVVHSLHLGEIALENTGTEPLEQLIVTVSRDGNSGILEFAVAATSFASDESAIKLEGDTELRVAHIDYLNRNDRIVFTCTLAGERTPPKVVVRKLGVDVVTKKDFVRWIPDIYAEVVYEAFSQLPGFNVIGRLVKPYNLYLKARKRRTLPRQTQSTWG